MNTYYCVTTAFYDDGRVVAGITDTIEAQVKPENTFTEKRNRDIYNDWFESEAEAMVFVETARRA